MRYKEHDTHCIVLALVIVDDIKTNCRHDPMMYSS
jgi:hypothetical protein